MPPSQLPQIVAGSIESLNENGIIVIFDFDSYPQSEKFHHNDKISSYKCKFDECFSWIPFMHLIDKSVAELYSKNSLGNQKEDCATSVIRKITLSNAYPQMTGNFKI